jgi:hypothetical protein
MNAEKSADDESSRRVAAMLSLGPKTSSDLEIFLLANVLIAGSVADFSKHLPV